MSRLRLRGFPTSSNGASSFHLNWLPRVLLSEVAVTLLIPQNPEPRSLYFWALQASFTGPQGTSGGAHLGLQWHPGYPDGTAVNWGGYDRHGSILEGTPSELPSVLANPHTRDYPWRPGVAYRLRIVAAAPGRWAGEVTDFDAGTTTRVRTLSAEGEGLSLVLVWSEVFARCDDPPAVAVWSDPAGVAIDGSPWRPDSYSVTYQREEDGGCSNTDVVVLPHGVGQFTGVTRRTPPGTVIPTQAV